jgi:hypothetical protein
MKRPQTGLRTPTDDARHILREAGRSIRNRGHTQEHAYDLLAQYFGLTLFRVQRLVFGKSVRVLDAELACIRQRYIEHLKEESALLSARLAASRDRLRRTEAGERIDYAREPGTDHIAKPPVKRDPFACDGDL